MFKSVEYTGFDGQPELEAKARELTPILANQIRTWCEDVHVKWSPPKDVATGVLDLTLSRTLVNGIFAEHTGEFTQEDLAEDWLVRYRCFKIADDLLGELLTKQHKRVEEGFAEMVEA